MLTDNPQAQYYLTTRKNLTDFHMTSLYDPLAMIQGRMDLKAKGQLNPVEAGVGILFKWQPQIQDFFLILTPGLHKCAEHIFKHP